MKGPTTRKKQKRHQPLAPRDPFDVSDGEKKGKSRKGPKGKKGSAFRDAKRKDSRPIAAEVRGRPTIPFLAYTKNQRNMKGGGKVLYSKNNRRRGGDRAPWGIREGRKMGKSQNG